MATALPKSLRAGLEGSCDAMRLRFGPPHAGIERLEARFATRGFAPHRHDTYGVGVTLAGVQRFRYRGVERHCLPGQCHILHPDELHDGTAGSAAGFAYRIVHLDPALLRQALGARPLPFVADPVIGLPPGWRARLAPAWDIDVALDELGGIDLVVAVAEMLAMAAREARAQGALHLPALARVRERIAAEPAARLPAPVLERLSGLDRWSLARQFRAAYGTSPSRFRTLRQLDAARRLMAQGCALAEAAVAAGFADQSHMSRQFKRAYGLTPGRWAAALRETDAPDFVL